MLHCLRNVLLQTRVFIVSDVYRLVTWFIRAAISRYLDVCVGHRCRLGIILGSRLAQHNLRCVHGFHLGLA